MSTADTEIRIVLDAQGNPSIVKVNKSIDDQTKKVDKNTKTKKKGEQQSKRNQAVEKSLYQTSLNSTKGFSKQARAMGGSSGLVAAYATLAANVFAATAAFSALSRAAQFEQLSKGLKELGHQSGQTLSIMAQGLRDVTGGAISAEESMRAAALGVSGGFGGKELEGLAKIAKGASITLGRSLPDAFDRLTRGAIKLEPEILDELGIMVRLDDAVDNYATSIGKTGAQLTQMERRQAFMNAILEQGEAKFGDIADAIEPDVYARLGATFADLTKNIFSFVNEFLRVGKVVGFLADNMVVLSGVMLLFGSTIAGKMLPFLASSAEGSLKAAAAAQEYAIATEAAGKAELKRIEGGLGKKGAVSKPYMALAKGLETSKNKTKTLDDMQKSLNASMGHYQREVKSADKAVKKAAKDKIALLKYEQLQLKRAIELEQGKGAAAFASGKSKQVQLMQEAATTEIVSFTNKEQSFSQAWKNIGLASNQYGDELEEITKKTLKNGEELSGFGKIQIWAGKQTKAFTQRLVLLKAAFLQLLPWVAAAVIVIGTIVALQRKWFNTDEQKKYQKGLDDMATLFDELSEKVEKYDKALANGKDLAAAQMSAFKIQSGVIEGINDQLKENIRLRKLAAESRGEEEDVGGVMQSPSAQGHRQRQIELYGAEGLLGRVGEEANDYMGITLKELQLSADAFSSLNIENPFEWMEDMDVDNVLDNLMDMEGSLEAEALKQLFTEGIPGQADFMMEKLKVIMGKDLNQDQLLKALQGIVQETDEAFGPLGPTIEGLAAGFKEAEKEATKYLRSFAKKTSVDDFIASTSSTIKIIDDLKVSLRATGKDIDAGVGIALLNVGSTLSDIMGPGFKEAQRDLKAAGEAMKAAGKVIGDGSDESNLVNDLAADLAEKYEGRLKDVNKNLKDTQRFELTRKTLISGIDKMMKFAGKNYKRNAQLAGLENKQLLKKLNLEQKIQESKIKEVKTLFEIQKYNIRDSEGQITDQQREIEYADFMKKNLTEQLDIAEQSGVGAQNLFALKESMMNQALRQLDIEKNIAQQEDIALIQRTEAEMNLLKIGKELLDQRREISNVDMRLENFRKTGSTSLDARQEAQFKVDAAKDAAKFARDNLNSELDIIDARASIQKTEMEILQKQIELYNQEAKDTHTGPGAATQIEKLDLDKAFEAIDKLALLEKGKVLQTTELLQKKVPLAAAEGAENILEAMQSGDLWAGSGIQGIGNMFEEMRKGEIVLKDSKEAATFFEEAMSGNTLPGDAKIEKAIHKLPDQLAGKNLTVAHNESGSLMTQTIDEVLNNLDLSIPVEKLLKDAEAQAEAGADPWKKLPVGSLLALLDEGLAGAGGTWNEEQLEIMKSLGIHGGVIQDRQTETERKRLTAGGLGEEMASSGVVEESLVQEIWVAAKKRAPKVVEAIVESVSSYLMGTGFDPFIAPDSSASNVPDIREIEVTAQKRSLPLTVIGKDQVGGGISGINPDDIPNAGNTDDVFGISTDDDDAAAKRAEKLKNMREQVMKLQGAMAGLNQHLAAFGPEGEAIISFREGMTGMMHSVLNFKEASGPEAMQERLAATAGIINSFAQMLAASSDKKVAGIDKEIAAEKKRDGKTKQSQERILALEKKKEKVGRKAFAIQKAVMLAQTAISTSASIMAALAPPPLGLGPVAGSGLATAMGVMGAIQMAFIASQQYGGFTAGKPDASGAAAEISVGKRSNKVDTSKRASSGELAYLRGERGIGTNANNFVAQNGAAGLRKGYADGGQIVVGERGPETITPLDAMQVWPSGPKQGAPINANITINAVDAAGVEEVLMGQQGHIINMLRSAANENGEEFLESIDTQTYGNPQSAGGIDY